MEPVGNVIMALGRPKLLLRAVMVPVALELCFLPLVAIKWGLPAVAWLVCGAYTVQWVVYGPFLKRELGVEPGRILKAAIPVAVAAVSAVLTARTVRLPDPLSWATLMLRSVAVCAIFIVIHEMLTRGAMLSEVKLAMKFRMRKPFGTLVGSTIPPPATTPDVM